MSFIFDVTDKTGRKIHLTDERWKHIRKKHPEIESSELLQEAIEKSDKITNTHLDPKVNYFWKHYKNRLGHDKFLLVVVKYLNGDGYVLSSYYEDKIQ